MQAREFDVDDVPAAAPHTGPVADTWEAVLPPQLPGPAAVWRCMHVTNTGPVTVASVWSRAATLSWPRDANHSDVQFAVQQAQAGAAFTTVATVEGNHAEITVRHAACLVC